MPVNSIAPRPLNVSSPLTPPTSADVPAAVSTFDTFSRRSGIAGTTERFNKRFINGILEQRSIAQCDSNAPLSMLCKLSKTQIETKVAKLDKKLKSPVSGAAVVDLFNRLKMKKLHHKTMSASTTLELLYTYARYRSEASTSSSSPAWSVETLQDADLGDFRVDSFFNNFKEWIQNEKPVTLKDQGINFQSTSNNKIEVLSDKEQFWPVLMQDLASAQDSVNINMFGLTGDAWGKEVFDLLIDKVRNGVKVRVLADSLGARMHWHFGHSNADFIEYLKENGVEIILTRDDNTYGNFHFDHRKFYVIDGKLAHNTGYTIEEHMRHIHFDQSTRIQGDMVAQLQASFFTSWLYFGGKVNNQEESTDFSSFYQRYFPENTATGDVTARLVTNIPHVQHRATETYYDSLKAATEKIGVINEFLSDNELMKIIKEKAKAGVEVEIIFPRVFEWEGYGLIAHEFFDKIKHLPNVKIYIYDGPENHGWLHTKGIVVDGSYVNFGSTNMDELAMYHNYEVNVEIDDPRVAAEVQEEVMDYAISHSTEYKNEPSIGRSIKTTVYRFLKKILEP